jgi:hypothetical protein
MNRLFLGILILAVASLSSCAKKTVLYDGDGKMEEFDPVYAAYDYLDAKAKIVIEEGTGKVTRGTMSLRAKKDSVLWFTVSPGMGMEAIRGLITKDKIMIKDRVGKEDINLTFTEFEMIYGLKLSLDLFQNILWANPAYPFDYQDRLLRVGKKFELTQVREKVRYFSKVEESHGKVSELTSNSLDDRGTLLASYPKFLAVENQPFPAQVLYKLAYQLPEGSQNIIIHLEWTSIQPFSGPLNFPFRF